MNNLSAMVAVESEGHMKRSGSKDSNWDFGQSDRPSETELETESDMVARTMDDDVTVKEMPQGGRTGDSGMGDSDGNVASKGGRTTGYKEENCVEGACRQLLESADHAADQVEDFTSSGEFVPLVTKGGNKRKSGGDVDAWSRPDVN